MVTIDGAEGGGQILRTAVSLSALSGRPLRVINIRGSRPKPGLRPQHLLSIMAAAKIADADVEGACLGSTEIEFHPKSLSAPPEWRLEIGTAGSLTLLLQCLLPCLVRSPSPCQLELTGGTNNPWAPPVEYMQQVLLPILGSMGVNAELRLLQRGFYPKGGGQVEAQVGPTDSISPLHLTNRGELKRIWGLSYSSRLPGHIGKRMAESARQRLTASGYQAAEIDLDANGESASPGCGIILFAQFEEGAILAADALGKRGKKAEAVGEEAAQALIRELESGAPVDRHLGDQLVVWAALADGESRYTTSHLTDHTRSAIQVAQTIVGSRFEMQGEAPATISCQGWKPQ